jgi:hypothetical protein
MDLLFSFQQRFLLFGLSRFDRFLINPLGFFFCRTNLTFGNQVAQDVSGYSSSCNSCQSNYKRFNNSQSPPVTGRYYNARNHQPWA